jgi:hypothetical protein
MLVALVAVILGQMDVDPGPSVKIKFAESGAKELAKEMSKDVEALLQTGLEKNRWGCPVGL